MPNVIDANGLQIATLTEYLARLTSGFQTIYGADININPNSPDGQLINLLAQEGVDMSEFISQVNDSFDPDTATGIILDLRCAINGVLRLPGTYSVIPADVVFNSVVTINGLDTAPNSPFTIQDLAGNKWYLVNTYTSTGVETKSLQFRASVFGPLNPSINTINILGTPVYGVVSANNPTVALSIGSNQESDVQLRLRRQQSVTLPSKSWWQGLWASLISAGVRDAKIYENVTGTTDANGIPGHSIWCVIDDNALYSSSPDTVLARATEIAEIIYVHKNAGCGIKPAGVSPAGWNILVPQADGSTVEIDFDPPVQAPLYVKLTCTALPGTAAVDPVYIAKSIYNYFSIGGEGAYKIGQAADSSAIVSYVKGLLPNVSISGEGVSQDGSTWLNLIPIDGLLGHPSLQSRWNLGVDYTTNIIIS